MRELILIADESTESSLVLRLDEGDTGTENQTFVLPVTPALRAILAGEQDKEEPAEPPIQAVPTPEPKEEKDPAEPAAAEPQPQRETRVVDPRLSNPLKMRPREIQDRIRGGASIAQLAELNGVTEGRIAAYAHPILAERTRVAELAKKSHPVRHDGPATLTLWEILATACAARGIDLLTTSWDAFRDVTGQWVIVVTLLEGEEELRAEWSFHRQGLSPATTAPRNAIASELLDPAPTPQVPLRGLTAVPAVEDDDITRDDIPRVVDSAEDSGADVQEIAGEDFLQSPPPAPAKSKRRRKAVTPNWEDVLLGVRTNTKRPRS